MYTMYNMCAISNILYILVVVFKPYILYTLDVLNTIFMQMLSTTYLYVLQFTHWHTWHNVYTICYEYVQWYTCKHPMEHIHTIHIYKTTHVVWHICTIYPRYGACIRMDTLYTPIFAKQTSNLYIHTCSYMRVLYTTNWPHEIPHSDHPQPSQKGMRLINMWKLIWAKSLHVIWVRSHMWA